MSASRDARSAARVSIQTAAWLVLAMPLAGMLADRAAATAACCAGAPSGWVGTAAIGLSFVFALITFFKLQDLPVRGARRHLVALGPRERRRRPHPSSASTSTRCRR